MNPNRVLCLKRMMKTKIEDDFMNSPISSELLEEYMVETIDE